jgi:hypothetical protein
MNLIRSLCRHRPCATAAQALLAWLLGKSITRISPCGKDIHQPIMFSRSEFTYNAERDVYVCPNSRPLRTS